MFSFTTLLLPLVFLFVSELFKKNKADAASKRNASKSVNQLHLNDFSEALYQLYNMTKVAIASIRTPSVDNDSFSQRNKNRQGAHTVTFTGLSDINK